MSNDYPVIVKTDKRGQPHQLIRFSGLGSDDIPCCKAFDVEDGSILTIRKYHSHELQMMEAAKRSKTSLIFKLNGGSPVQVARVPSAAETYAAREFEGQAIFFECAKRLSNRFSRSALKGGQGRINITNVPVLCQLAFGF